MASVECIDCGTWFASLSDRALHKCTPSPTIAEQLRDPPPEQVRGKTHGDYTYMSGVIQDIKLTMRRGQSWEKLSAPQAEALELIATKIGRIVCGDPNFRDHWADIIGYANLIKDRIAEKSSA